MNFHDISFPLSIAFHSTGGPVRKTEIVTLGSGHEERNAVWAGSRRSFDVGSGVRTLNDLYAVLEFFEARAGRLYGFRFKDFADFRSAAQLNVQPASGSHVDFLDEFEIDDLLPVGAEEQFRIESGLQAHERLAEQRLGQFPMQAHVVSL